MNKPIHVLIIEDSEPDTLLLVRELRRGGYDPVHRRVETAEAMAAALAEETWDVITADHNMPRFNSVAALKLLREKGLDVPFIIVSGTIGEEAAVEAMRAGAQDYLVKDRLARLVPAVERELAEAAHRRGRLQAELALLAQQEQLRIARDIQQGLFPAAQPDLDGYDVAGLSFPAEATGGDYFDYIPMPEDHLGLVIGDVTGHGLGASLLMAEMRACLRTLALGGNDVRAILTQANRLTRQDFGTERFLTLLFARLHPRTRSLVYLNAGHPSGYVLDRQGNIRAELKSASMPLGLHPLTDFPHPGSLTLAAGDLVVLVTDGLLEALAGEADALNPARILELVRAQLDRSAGEIVALLCRTAFDSLSQAPPADDITALVLKVQTEPAAD